MSEELNMTFDEWCLHCRDKGYAVVKINTPEMLNVTNTTQDHRETSVFETLMAFIGCLSALAMVLFTIIYMGELS